MSSIGKCYYIAHTNDFRIKDLESFVISIKGFVGGRHESSVQFNYSECAKHGKTALLNMSSDDFDDFPHKENDPEIVLDLLQLVKDHIMEGEVAIFHVVTYEHGSDMCIYKYIITPENGVLKETILEN